MAARLLERHGSLRGEFGGEFWLGGGASEKQSMLERRVEV